MNPEEMQETPQQAIERYTTDFTKLAADGKLAPVIGREDEIRRTVQVLTRRTKNNPVLIGNPGVGKTAIVEGLAYRLQIGDTLEIIVPGKIEPVEFKIESLWDIETDEEIAIAWMKEQGM